MTDPALLELADLVGVQRQYTDVDGQIQVASEAALRAMIESLGIQAYEPAEAVRSLRREQARRVLEPVVVVWDGQGSVRVHLPDKSAGRYQLTIQPSGLRASGKLEELEVRNRETLENESYLACEIPLPAGLPTGYHELHLEIGNERHTARLISAPRLAYLPPDPRRRWGVFLPLYALHSSRSDGIADFTDLRHLIDWVSEEGGDVVGTLPLLASFLEPPVFAPSPYTPASRLFWNELYLDLHTIPEWRRSKKARALFNTSSYQAQLRELRASGQVDYAGLARARRRVLEPMCAMVFDGDNQRRRELEAYIERNPELDFYARFRAAVETNGVWSSWSRTDIEDVDLARWRYHAYVQWCTHHQLADLAAHAREKGLGLYLDLPVGVQREGYDTWRNPELYCLDTSTGAPPDPLFRGGQNWGFPPLHPRRLRESGYAHFIDVVRNHLQFAGVLRLDHVMGLHRLFCIPSGMTATEGVYLKYRQEEQLAVLALESHRTQTVLIGEDLGTVPDVVRDGLQRHGIQRMHVQQFAMHGDPHGAFGMPAADVMASMNTHDTPTWEGWWQGADITDQLELDLLDAEGARRERQGREVVKHALQSWFSEQALLPAGSDSSGVLRASLYSLAASEARTMLVNLEDLWGETRPQNVPGTTMDQRPNWTGRAQLAFEAFRDMPDVLETLREVDRLRRGGDLKRVDNPHDAGSGVEWLTSDDIHWFNEGTHYRLYDKLGAHVIEVDGQKGTVFAVWAPDAREVSVIGDFNDWKPGRHRLKPVHSSGIWQGFIPGLERGTLYKFHLVSRYGGRRLEKSDPFAKTCEIPPKTASVVWEYDYTWDDDTWMDARAARQRLESPISIYEVHLGSWMRVPEDHNRSLSYREVAPKLAEHVIACGFTHVELLPIMEHPFFGSWGYQTTGYFAPTSRFGTPEDFMYLVDYLHQKGIGVILDWVPSHFPEDPHGLAQFDGTHLFEHADPRKGFHPDWQSCIFNYGRNEVRAFLISSAASWLDRFHIDGIRVDAVASMLYLDYSREEGEWIPNEYGGRENLDAIKFLRDLNMELYTSFPGIQTFAEESTAWPMVSRPVYVGGLGFGFKWDMGWMHDTLEYMKKEPVHRKFHHGELTFRMVYAFNENFVLALSHDEVVHGKGSLLDRMPGDAWQKFANLRLLYGYMYGQPGKKLLFMGQEFGQGPEWQHDSSLSWDQVGIPEHAGVMGWIGDLNDLYQRSPALHTRDNDHGGFEWIHLHGAAESVLAFLRRGHKERECVVVAANFTPVPRYDYAVGVPFGGAWREVANSDAREYGGSGLGNLGTVQAVERSAHGRPYSLELTLPPLGIVFLEPAESGG